MEQCEFEIRQLVSSGTTHKRISELLQETTPGANGLSERSMRRFVKTKGYLTQSSV